MIAHYTHGNVLTVKKLLRHKRIESTMKYIHMIKFNDDEFEVATATTVEEAKELLAAGSISSQRKTMSCSSKDPKSLEYKRRS